MKIDFPKELTELGGEVLKDEKGEPVTMKTVCINALMNLSQDDANLSGEDKLKRFDLATVIYAGENPDIKVEDVALIKTLVGKMFMPLIVGQAWRHLDPPTEQKK